MCSLSRESQASADVRKRSKATVAVFILVAVSVTGYSYFICEEGLEGSEPRSGERHIA